MADDKIKTFVLSTVADLLGDPATLPSLDAKLVGTGAVLKSRALVELLLAVEDFLDVEYGASFNWYSDSALSDAHSRLRTVGSLIELMTEKAAVGHAG